MVESLKYRIQHDWNIIRLVRLAFSVIIMIQAFQVQEPLLAVLGGIFLFQATFNYGCCAGGACPNRPVSAGKDGLEQTDYTEIK